MRKVIIALRVRDIPIYVYAKQIGIGESRLRRIIHGRVQGVTKDEKTRIAAGLDLTLADLEEG